MKKNNKTKKEERKDAYVVLGINKDANSLDIKKAYRTNGTAMAS